MRTVSFVASNGCVLSTIMNGFSRGYNFVILKDLVETTDNSTRQQLQKLLIEFTFPKMYGITMMSKEFLPEMIGLNHSNGNGNS